MSKLPPLPKPEWGSLSRLPSGRIRLRGYTNGEPVSIGSYDTVDEALGVALAMKREMAGLPRGLTVSEWASRWLDRRERQGRHRGVGTTRILVEAYLHGTALGDRLLRDVKPKHVARWLDALSERPSRQGGTLSDRSLSNALTAVRTCLGDAVRAGHLDSNPAVGVARPRARAATRDAWTYLTTAELDQLMTAECFNDPRGWRPRLIFILAAFTGLRQGELWGLQWQDVHLDEDQPHLVVRYGDGQKGPTKGGRIRRVPLFPPAREVLRTLRDADGVHRALGHVFLNAGTPPAKGYDSGWAGKWHRPKRGPHRGQRIWSPGWCEKAGLGGAQRLDGLTPTFHSLRHTCASHLVMGTWGRPWRLEEIAQVLGHSTVKVTERYAHLAPEGMRRTVDEAERLWSGPTLSHDTPHDTRSGEG